MFSYSPDALLQRAVLLIPLILSLTIHEWAHAWSAWKLGDDTAARMGRLSLNPLVHIDLLGTILLPLLGIPFGWAKPVPVDPARFRRTVSMRAGMFLTASAGPLSNFALALLATLAIGLLYRFSPGTVLAGSPAYSLLSILISMNVMLGLFNLIPVPPLDGSRLADWLMPASLRPAWETFSRFAPFALLAVIWFGPSLISVPYAHSMQVLNRLLQAIT